jgi:hypothetical protein
MATRSVKPPPRAKPSGRPWPSKLVNVAREAGLTAPIIYGAESGIKYLTETSSGGAALVDYDDDGWLDVFIVSGTRFEKPEPNATNRLYRNNREGTFTDVTAKAGLSKTGWGQGVCAGDFNNDGFLDLFVTYWGDNVLYRNNGDGTFRDVTAGSGLLPREKRSHPHWYSGATFVDYDRDGFLDLFVTSYVDFNLDRVPKPGENEYCNWKGVPTPCGPRGLPPGRQFLYRNRGDGTFEDVSQKSGIGQPRSSFGLTAVATDFDGDGWPDIYLACDSTPSLFFRNNRDGTFTEEGLERGLALNESGMEQAGMGLGVGDFDNDGRLDILKTHFAEDTNGLYRGTGNGQFADVTLKAGLGVETRFVTWGAGMPDLDNDGWPDLFMVTGNVYPDTEKQLKSFPYRSPALLFRNLADGRFEQLGPEAGPALEEVHSSRGSAFGDFDNDGDIDVLAWNRNEPPSLFRNDLKSPNQWLKLRLVGRKSNRAAIGAIAIIDFEGRRQAQPVLSQSSYTSVNDLRLHFGLGPAAKAGVVVQWPSGVRERFTAEAGKVTTLEEGTGAAATIPVQ